ncbi:MAG: hypothetical protein J5489_01450, partial [Lachnospiraceae bacterium]|nr:hypothetical protein [Lachnospiraceae bacterium]
IYKLNFAKTKDYDYIREYLKELDSIPAIAGTINVRDEVVKAYRGLEDDRNPYHIVFQGDDNLSLSHIINSP